MPGKKSYDLMTINRISIDLGKWYLESFHIFKFNTNLSAIMDYWLVNKWKQVAY